MTKNIDNTKPDWMIQRFAKDVRILMDVGVSENVAKQEIKKLYQLAVDIVLKG